MIKSKAMIRTVNGLQKAAGFLSSILLFWSRFPNGVASLMTHVPDIIKTQLPISPIAPPNFSRKFRHMQNKREKLKMTPCRDKASKVFNFDMK